MAKLNYFVLGLLWILGPPLASRADDPPRTTDGAPSEAEGGEGKERSGVAEAKETSPLSTDENQGEETKAKTPAEPPQANGEQEASSAEKAEEPAPEAKPQSAPEAKPQSAPEAKPQSAPEAELQSASEAELQSASEAELQSAAIDESQFENVEKPEVEPYAKGDMEAALNLAMAGSGDYFYFGAGASYAYYVIDRLAPGIEINYTHVFLNQDFGYGEPNTVTMLPFLKFVVMRSRSVAPYLIATGGYQAEWGSDVATNAWIAGGGGGVHVGLGKHFALNIQLLALYYWYGNTRVYSYRDGGIVKYEGGEYVCSDSGSCDRDFEEGNGAIFAAKTDASSGDPFVDSNTGMTSSFVECTPDANGALPPECLQSSAYLCNREGAYCAAPYKDPGDKRRELFFPLITFGITYFF